MRLHHEAPSGLDESAVRLLRCEAGERVRNPRRSRITQMPSLIASYTTRRMDTHTHTHMYHTRTHTHTALLAVLWRKSKQNTKLLKPHMSLRGAAGRNAERWFGGSGVLPVSNEPSTRASLAPSWDAQRLHAATARQAQDAATVKQAQDAASQAGSGCCNSQAGSGCCDSQAG